MLPVLLDLRFLKIYTFGVFLVLAFFWGMYLLWRNIRLMSHKEDEVFDSLFLSLAGGLFVGRLVHVMLNFEKFGFSVLKFILINGYPGISLFGFIAGFIGVLYLALLIRKISFRDTIDYFVPAAFLSLGFAKLGSFFAGIEVGKVTKFPLAVHYVGAQGLRHLPALYEAIFFFMGAYVTSRILFAIRRDTFSRGFNFIFFLWFFALVTAAFDALKANHLILAGVSFNLIMAGVLGLTFSMYFLYYFRSHIFAGVAFFTSSITKHGKLFNKKLRNEAKDEA